jgi:hypothetical protein
MMISSPLVLSASIDESATTRGGAAFFSASTWRRGEEGILLAMDPIVKPVAMVADAILDCSCRGNIVLDPLAAER